MCHHDGGIIICKENYYEPGCTFRESEKYVKCRKCDKILVESHILEELEVILKDENR
jgi:hypothetical protein